MAEEIHLMKKSSGVQWRKPSCNFALESFDYSTNLSFPFLTIPVRHFGGYCVRQIKD